MKLLEQLIQDRSKFSTSDIVENLDSGLKELINSNQYKNYLKTMAKFHKYSFGNIMLILKQKPDASNVSGFKSWKEFNRGVKRGEKAIFILAPITSKISTKVEKKILIKVLC